MPKWTSFETSFLWKHQSLCIHYWDCLMNFWRNNHWANSQNDNYFHSKQQHFSLRTLLIENSCHFVNLVTFSKRSQNSDFYLSLTQRCEASESVSCIEKSNLSFWSNCCCQFWKIGCLEKIWQRRAYSTMVYKCCDWSCYSDVYCYCNQNNLASKNVFLSKSCTTTVTFSAT